MDNFAQKNGKKEETADIQFEEVFDIDEIQRKLQESIDKNDPEEDSGEVINPTLLFTPKEEIKEVEQKPTPTPVVAPQVQVDLSAKKYVIYIDPNNIDFMESLPSDDRRTIINKILKEQNIVLKDRKRQQAKTRFITHVMLACATFVICFPIMFVAANKALEATIANYKQSKQNFTRLYREQGKIKMQDAASLPNAKY